MKSRVRNAVAVLVGLLILAGIFLLIRHREQPVTLNSGKESPRQLSPELKDIDLDKIKKNLAALTRKPLPQRRVIINEKNEVYSGYLRDSIPDSKSNMRSLLPETVRTLYLEDVTEESLEELLNNDDEFLRVQSAGMLARLGRDDVRALLESALKRPSPIVRLEAAAGLAALGEPESIDELISLLSAPSWGIRLQTVETIGYTGQPALSELIRPLLNDPSINVRVATAASLLRLGDENVKGILYNALKTPDSAIQYRAAFALAEAGDPAPLDFLRKEYKEHDLSVKAHMAYYMALLGDLSGIPALNEALIKGDDETRAFALAALTALSTPSK